MKYSKPIIDQFGGATALSRLLGHKHCTTVHRWYRVGHIPQKYHQKIFNLARKLGHDVVPSDFSAIKEPKNG